MSKEKRLHNQNTYVTLSVVLWVCAVKYEQMCVRNGLVPLTKSGPTVGTPSLTQCKAEQDAQGKEEDGAQDAQACEVIFQDPHSAGRAATHYHHRGLNYGI